jgi:hypothetical protein
MTWNLPNCLGALNVKHVSIVASPNRELYLIITKFYIVCLLLALVDAKHNFIMVDVGCYEKNTIGGIFSNYNFGKTLANNKLNIPEATPLTGTRNMLPCVLARDEAFPLKQNLLKP